MTQRVALATYARLPALDPDDRLLVPALATRGIAAEAAIWGQPIDWARFDAVVIRSCWDYHLRIAEFLEWLAALAARDVRVLNPPSLLRWNADKRYLLDLADRGVGIVPTRLVPKSGTADLACLFDELGVDEVVVKPAVSASAHRTWRASRRMLDADRARWEEMIAGGDVLVQPFVREVSESGEWSLVCFDGQPSHAVLKRPAPGEWRVQHDFGGTAKALPPPTELLCSAAQILGAARADHSTYARVDGCLTAGAFRLMELELIEPQLFIGLGARAADRFADAIVAGLR